jgi:sugar phosphate isomerase/epimerase
MSRPVVAAQLYTIRAFTQTPKDLAESLTKIKQMGYTAVQVSAIGAVPDAEVKSMVDDLGLKICITHIGYDRLWKDTESVIAQHKLWDCRHVAIGSMPPAYREEGEAGFRRFATEAAAVGEKLAQAGLTFSYHNHSFEFVRFGSRTGLDIIYETADPRYLQSEIDTYWVQYGGGDPAEWIRRMKGRAPVVHYKDMVIVDNQPTMAEIGEGNLNWPAIIKATEEAGSEYAAVEQDICRRDPFESLQISYNNLRGMGLS